MEPAGIDRQGRLAAALVMVGLLIQLAATFYWTPATFVASVALGVPLVVLGVAIFARAVWRARGRDL